MQRNTLYILAIAIVVGGLYYYSSSNTPSEEVLAPNETTEVSGDLGNIQEESANYTLDTAASTLDWTASRITGGSHNGLVAIDSGTMSLEKGLLTSGEFVIDMTRISESNDNTRFLGHIASDDFFSVADFPTATLALKKAEPVSGDGTIVNYQVTGDLTIRGITNEVTFDAMAELEENLMFVTSEFQIDRTRWEITYDSGSVFLEIGDKAIRDEIDFSLNLTFNRS